MWRYDCTWILLEKGLIKINLSWKINFKLINGHNKWIEKKEIKYITEKIFLWNQWELKCKSMRKITDTRILKKGREI